MQPNPATRLEAVLAQGITGRQEHPAAPLAATLLLDSVVLVVAADALPDRHCAVMVFAELVA